MKRITFVLVLAVMIMAACNKVETSVYHDPKPDNYATVGNISSKDDGKPIEITYTVGHDASECGYSCIILNGNPGHADCQGWGDACLITIRIWPIGGGQPKGETFSAVVDTVWSLTTEDFFNMPDRSLAVLDAPSENARYLNIPAQLVFRDTVTQQFTFTGLFFSEDAVYTND